MQRSIGGGRARGGQRGSFGELAGSQPGGFSWGFPLNPQVKLVADLRTDQSKLAGSQPSGSLAF